MLLDASALGYRTDTRTSQYRVAIRAANARFLTPWVLGLLFLPNCPAQSRLPYAISTVAGFGLSNIPTGAYGGDGGLATGAYLNLPTSVALDSAGNIYVSDWSARIRKVDRQTGIITTIAGTGVRGSSGDGGPAKDAQLGGPGDIVVDRVGNIYFADGSNHRVRRVSAKTGIIETIAGNGSGDTGLYRTVAGKTSVMNTGDGGLAIEAGIGTPGGLGVDAVGNIYFTNGGDRVRKIAADTGIITTIAGAGGSYHSGDKGPAVLAQLAQPSKVAIDSEGNIYIAARGEHRIRKVNVATGIIATVAGSGHGEDAGPLGMIRYEGGFGGDGGPATEALLNNPENIALDKTGNLYISDSLNYRIRRVDANTGIITTIAGTGTRGFGGDGGSALGAQITMPSGLVVGSAGQVYFADIFNHRVRVLMPGFRAPPL